MSRQSVLITKGVEAPVFVVLCASDYGPLVFLTASLSIVLHATLTNDMRTVMVDFQKELHGDHQLI